MKAIINVILLASITFSFTSGNKPPVIEYEKGAYKNGEKLEYRLHYGFVNAGRASITIDHTYSEISDKPCYKVNVHGWSTGLLQLGFKIKDTWSSFIDTATFEPRKSYRNIEEGKYKLIEEVLFDTQNKLAKVHRKHPDREKEEFTFKIPDNVQDIVSGFYELRRINFNKLKVGDTIAMNAFFDKVNYNFKVRYMGKGTVVTDAGKFNAIKIVPVMPKNGLFNGEESIKTWISDDKNKIPILVEAEMFVGAIQLELTSYKGLKNEVNLYK